MSTGRRNLVVSAAGGEESREEDAPVYIPFIRKSEKAAKSAYSRTREKKSVCTRNQGILSRDRERERLKVEAASFARELARVHPELHPMHGWTRIDSLEQILILSDSRGFPRTERSAKDGRQLDSRTAGRDSLSLSLSLSAKRGKKRGDGVARESSVLVLVPRHPLIKRHCDRSRDRQLRERLN